MAFAAETGGYKASRSDLFMVDPRALVVDWAKNLSRNGEEPPVDNALMDLAMDMLPKTGSGESSDGSSGQLNPILVRRLPDRRLEVIGGFRRMRAALWLIESGRKPDFTIKYIVSTLGDAEAALVNISENIQREDPKPIQLAHAIRCLTEDYGMEMKDVAGRLKRSEDWCHKLIDLVMLPVKIQESVANGETPVAAAIELTKLPAAKQVKAFETIKGEGKVTAAKVREKRRQETLASPETAKSEKIPRTLKELKNYLETLTGPADNGSKIAKMLIKFANGECSEEAANKVWDKVFNSEN